MNIKELTERNKEQQKYIFELIAKVVEIINRHSLWGDGDEYIFDNKETWYRFDPDYHRARHILNNTRDIDK